MSDQNITELPVKTSSGITSSDYMLGIDSAEGYQMLIRDLGDYIIRNVQVNTIAGANQTLKAALDTLNSKVHDFGSIGNGMTYAQIFEHVYSSIPDGAFVFSVNSSGAKMFVGVKNGSNYAAAIYINFNGSWGRVINDNGTFSQS